jgi:hypothetical protein
MSFGADDSSKDFMFITEFDNENEHDKFNRYKKERAFLLLTMINFIRKNKNYKRNSLAWILPSS